MRKVFQINKESELKLNNIYCDVAILEGRSNELVVNIENAEDSDFRVTQTNGAVTVEQIKSQNSQGVNFIGDVFVGGSVTQSVVSGSGTSVIQSNGNTYISGNSGKVFVNGKEVNLDNLAGDEKPKEPVKIIIIAPKVGLEAELKGVATLASKSLLGSVYISAQGSVMAGVIADSLDITSSGSSKIKAVLNGGDLDISGAGSSDVEIQGSWNKASVQASGSAYIKTIGLCHGDYKASASGSASIVHSGSVGGRVRQTKSGVANIRIS